MFIMLKDGITIDLKQSENIKVTKQDFDQALWDVKPVSMPSSHVIWLWCHYHPQAFGVSSEQLDDYMGNGQLSNIVYKHMSIYIYHIAGFNCVDFIFVVEFFHRNYISVIFVTC